MEDSYFSAMTPALGDSLSPLSAGEDTLDDLFILSGCNTPMETGAGDGVHAGRMAHRSGNSVARMRYRPNDDGHKSAVSSDNAILEHSRPIPIQYAKPKSVALIEPVSARGDLAEAYFPLHEKEGDRKAVYQPHPFEQEVKRARQRSIDEAEASASATPAHGMSPSSRHPAPCGRLGARPVPAVRRTDADVPAAIAGPPRIPGATWRTRTAPVVDGYNPTGIRGSAVSLGRYHPTNYRQGSDTAGPRPPSPGAASKSPLSLSGADQAHQLRQYKLDIISQTAQIARENLGRRLHSTASFKSVDTALDERTRNSVALLRRYKPSSPRITPLLSPGPVTPMALDGNGDSDYLGVREARSYQ